MIHFKHIEDKEKLSHCTINLSHNITVEDDYQNNGCKLEKLKILSSNFL